MSFVKGLKLQRFSAKNNELTGQQPLVLGKLAFLQVLQLHDNNLMGSIPTMLLGAATFAHLMSAPTKVSWEGFPVSSPIVAISR